TPGTGAVRPGRTLTLAAALRDAAGALEGAAGSDDTGTIASILDAIPDLIRRSLDALPRRA
ncbi:MAG TPA: hypothetical protein VE033_13425, partial [Acetobacteraceae bacterium]|nr:hypothetical protein [Acetobacteraceae bacterium]